MSFNIREIFSAALILFAVINILGSLPIIMDLRKKTGKIQSGKASISAGVIMVAFLFLGEQMLGLIGIDIYSFAIAGSIIIFFIALEMILGIKIHKGIDPAAVSIVPIAFPLLAGAGTLTTLLSLRAEYAFINIVTAIIINLLIIYGVLKLTKKLEHILGPGIISVIEKAFGVILLAIAVKLFGSNIGGLIQ